jgi:5-methylcytosine-specific restriction endonuclease McrA
VISPTLPGSRVYLPAGPVRGKFVATSKDEQMTNHALTVYVPRPPIPPAMRRALVAREGTICQYCGQDAAGRIWVDHIVPVCLGGPTELHNLVTACQWCNTTKAVQVWRPRNLDTVTAGHPEWRERIEAEAVAIVTVRRPARVKSVYTTLTQDTFDRATAAAEALGIDLAELIRRLLDEELDRAAALPKHAGGRPRKKPPED